LGPEWVGKQAPLPNMSMSHMSMSMRLNFFFMPVAWAVRLKNERRNARSSQRNVQLYDNVSAT